MRKIEAMLFTTLLGGCEAQSASEKPVDRVAQPLTATASEGAKAPPAPRLATAEEVANFKARIKATRDAAEKKAKSTDLGVLLREIEATPPGQERNDKIGHYLTALQFLDGPTSERGAKELEAVLAAKP